MTTAPPLVEELDVTAPEGLRTRRTITPRQPAGGEEPGWRGRRAAAAVVAAAFVVSLAVVDPSGVNTAGWSSFVDFWAAAGDPVLDRDFLEHVVDATTLTVGYAVLGTVLSVLIGIVGAPMLSSRFWETDRRPRSGRSGMAFAGTRAAWVLPRSLHEAVVAVLLVRVLGFDPMVAVLAIGVPFGAITAKVFAETLDEADPAPFAALRAAGASRTTALLYGLLPTASRDLTSYGFYRFECALRSSAILGVIGAGGLGQELTLSFTSLNYDEVWTLLYALIAVNFVADVISARVRQGGRRRATWTVVGIAVAAALSWRWTGLDVSVLWSERTRELGAEVLGELLHPAVGPDGLGALVDATVETAAMSVVAAVLAAAVGAGLAFAAARPQRSEGPPGHGRAALALLVRLVLLVTRAIPPPMWAFLFVLVLLPGALPGVVALAVYNTGVLGRLFAEAVEDRDPRPEQLLRDSGAGRVGVFLYATLPTVAPRFVALGLYRWEVIVRETVVVGLVGAGGLGRVIRDDIVARDLQAVSAAAIALIVLALLAELVGARLRAQLR